ncbi:MAG: DinB family protein [Chloroflexi bacterium]|nr:DinB family protein [Chloroflexota bacterium]MCC6895224.1 DinB family protein [Anaerolineae bacterium]
MIDAESLTMILERNYGVVMRQIDGITHEESLIQPPFRGNCMNWVLGHLVMSRERILIMIGAPRQWTQEQCDRYERGSEPIVAAQDALPFEKIVADYSAAQGQIHAWLKSCTPADLNVEAVPHRIPADTAPKWDWLEFLLWHEAYHIGNLELLRQLAGKNDKVIG